MIGDRGAIGWRAVGVGITTGTRTRTTTRTRSRDRGQFGVTVYDNDNRQRIAIAKKLEEIIEGGNTGVAVLVLMMVRTWRLVAVRVG